MFENRSIDYSMVIKNQYVNRITGDTYDEIIKDMYNQSKKTNIDFNSICHREKSLSILIDGCFKHTERDFVENHLHNMIGDKILELNANTIIITPRIKSLFASLLYYTQPQTDNQTGLGLYNIGKYMNCDIYVNKNSKHWNSDSILIGNIHVDIVYSTPRLADDLSILEYTFNPILSTKSRIESIAVVWDALY